MLDRANILDAVSRPGKTTFRGLVILDPASGTKYYRHIATNLSSADQVAAIDETLAFAGEGCVVESIRECTKEEHVSGISNCMFGYPRHYA